VILAAKTNDQPAVMISDPTAGFWGVFFVGGSGSYRPDPDFTEFKRSAF
jgi:hypothetical protein